MKGKIFNTQEVQAIIAGNKTMFREVIKPKINPENYSLPDECGMELLLSECPYQVGQKIFVKESFDYREHYSIGNYDHYTAWKKRPASKMKQEDSRLTLEITDVKVERLGDISEENLPQGFRQIKDRNHFMYDTHIKRIPCNCGNSSPTLLSSVNIRTFLKESAYKFMCPECKKTPNKTYITSNGASCYWNDLIDPSWREKSESTHEKPEEKFEANPFVWVVDFKINK